MTQGLTLTLNLALALALALALTLTLSLTYPNPSPNPSPNPNPNPTEAWRKGLTGYPMVDAGMRCLYATGYVATRPSFHRCP